MCRKSVKTCLEYPVDNMWNKIQTKYIFNSYDIYEVEIELRSSKNICRKSVKIYFNILQIICRIKSKQNK